MNPYRILVTGSRDWTDRLTLVTAILREVDDWLNTDVALVHGGCPTGADLLTHTWALASGIPVERYPAEWFGTWPACGPIRNRFMVGLGADVCLAFLGPCTSRRCRRTDPHTSHGATGCANLAEAAGIPVRRYTA